MTVRYFATIRDLTRETERPFRRAVFDGDDLHGEIIIFVNGRNVRHLQVLDTPLKDDDEVSIFPMIAGG